MKNQTLFNKTISILVKAFINGTLEHTNCYACAVQNIVAGNMGVNLIAKPKGHLNEPCEHITIVWPNLSYEKTLVIDLDKEEYELSNSKLIQLKSIGYTLLELREIEKVFEEIDPDNCKDLDEYVFNGLMAVCDCLMKIYEASEIEIKQAKELFVKA